MNYKSLLVKIFGWRAGLIHGSPTVLERWSWLKARLPLTKNQTLIDIGCGTGAFSIGASLRGYKVLGLSWDERNQTTARERAILSHAPDASFEILDVRKLHERPDLVSRFDVAILLEVIEHIVDDEKLMRDAAACLKPGGLLLLTTPNSDYKPITKEDAGPFHPVETGWHVRKGYRAEDLEKLCRQTGMVVEEISFCSGFLSQKITGLQRWVSRLHPLIGWAVILPLRPIPPLFDSTVTRWLRWPGYSICLQARKPPSHSGNRLGN